MSTLSYLLASLDDNQLDCIEFGHSGIPGRVEGAVRLRRSGAGRLQLSLVTASGGEQVVNDVARETLDSTLAEFTRPVTQRCALARFFGLRERGSYR